MGYLDVDGNYYVGDRRADDMVVSPRPSEIHIWTNGGWVEGAPIVPKTVTRFQARAALHLSGRLSDVEALMSDPETDVLAQLAWQDAQEFKRESPTVLGMATLLGLSAADLDALFISAGQINA